MSNTAAKIRRPVKSFFHLPRVVRRADYTPSAYTISDSPHGGYIVSKDGAPMWEHDGYHETSSAGVATMPGYVAREVERQQSADYLLGLLRPAKRTPGEPYTHTIMYASPEELPGAMAAFSTWTENGTRWQFSAGPDEYDAPTYRDFDKAEPGRQVVHGIPQAARYRLVEDRTTNPRHEYGPRSVVLVVQRSVSASGMYRRLSLFAPCHEGGTPRPITYDAARVIGWTLHRDYHDTIGVSGCGMDMHFHTVYTLAARLYGDGYALQAESI